jgi:hypothetical protein
MPVNEKSSYELVWDQENKFAFHVAKDILDKPKISVWLILLPILFLYYAHKIQQYKAGVHDFSKGLMRSKILALDSAQEEINTGQKNEAYKQQLGAEDPEASPNVLRVRQRQIAEVELLKSHYGKLLRQTGNSYQALIRKCYKNSGEYRRFLNQLAQAEAEVREAVLRAYHPDTEARTVTQKMEKIIARVREEEIKTFFA